MKISALLCLGLVMLSYTACQSPQTNLEAPSVAAVMAKKEEAGRACARVVLDGDKIMSVHLHGTDYLAALKKIDVSSCPASFRTAWEAYCAAWEQKLKAENAGEDTLDLISMWKGEIGDLTETYRHLEAYDTEPAWERCVQAAAASGVPAR
ncbi:MAG TPA: hypothetical protein VFB27_04520 [Opitutaceae bacterium]|nr:hypothetical protein [Opitutaceae bacterium]